VLAPWRAAAERRVEIDRHIAAIRADALAGLVQVSRAQGGPSPYSPPVAVRPRAGGPMIRAAIVFFLVAAIAVAVVALTGEPGAASLDWMGWRVEMTAAAAALLTLFTALLATILWRGLLWVIEAPQRAARARAEAKRKQGVEALSRGFLAVAAGDGSEARRLAQKASELAEDAPALVRVLAAQAAEAAGDHVAARQAYNAMLGFPEMRLAGLRGLMQTALAEGDKALALRHAETAYGLAKTARWAWRALLEARLEAGDWKAALALVQGALERKIVPPLVAERARAALLAASAAGLEESDDPKVLAQALDFATQAARLKPEFAPGVVMAARLQAADGKAAKAGTLIEAAWKQAPHPALWLAYRDLKTSETPKLRATRLAALANLKPEARESRLLKVESALIGGDPVAARAAARLLPEESLTAHRRPDGPRRLCLRRGRRGPRLGRPGRGRAAGARLVGSGPRGPRLRLCPRRLGPADRQLRRDRRADPPAVRASRAHDERAARAALGLCGIHAVRAGGRDRRRPDAHSRRPGNRAGNRFRRVRRGPAAGARNGRSGAASQDGFTPTLGKRPSRR
jgi:HemY protein